MKKFTLSILTIYCLSANAQPGTLDNSFGTGGIVTTEFSSADAGRSVVIQNDGKIIVAGEGNGIELARYYSDGSLDLTFGSAGKVITIISNQGCGVGAVAIQSDDKIVVGGYSNGDFAIVRYNNNGSLDNTFGAGGIVTTDFGNSEAANSLVIQNDGKIVLGGFTSFSANEDFALARYISNGSLDNTFGTGGKVTTSVTNLPDVAFAIALQPDGKILQTGSTNDTYDGAIVRYNTDGTLDNTFGSAGIANMPSVQGRAISLQTDGKIVIAGNTYSSVSGDDFVVMRFNSNGSADNSFGTGGKTVTAVNTTDGDYANSVVIQNDGKIIAGGLSIEPTNSPYHDFALLRYNGNGILDSTFGSGGITITDLGMSDLIFSMALQSDGKIIAAGTKDQPGYSAFAVARYNGDNSTGIVGLNNNDEINIFPNPSSGFFTVRILNYQAGARVTVHDVLGNCLLERNCQGETSQEINLSSQPKGIYFMEIVSEGERLVKKIVSQ